MNHMSISLTERFAEARALERKEYEEKERTRRGNLRGGTSGILLTETGESAGACVRKAHLRSLGVQLEEPTEDKLIMFDLGYASEDVVYKKLLPTLRPGEMILREEQIPTSWFTSNGTKVTGRPDIVICEEYLEDTIHVESDGTERLIPMRAARPLLGLELKSVHSMWTARDVLFQFSPKLANMAQSAHYMWQLSLQAGKDVPYKLIYSSYSQLGQGMAGTAEGWVTKMFPAPGDYHSSLLEYNYYKKVTKEVLNRKSGKLEMREVNSKCSKEEYLQTSPNKRDHGIKHLKQFNLIYDLKFDDTGRLMYREENDAGNWTPTIVTRDGIRDFYEYVSTMEAEKKVGPRPGQVDIHGEKAGYRDCDYCPLKQTCTDSEKLGYDVWLQMVQKRVAELAASEESSTFEE